MNKLVTLAISIAVTASILATPLASQEIIVSPRSHAVFVSNVQDDLNNQLNRLQFFSPWANSGATSVRFTAGADGRPDNIVTYRKSGSTRIDRAGRRAVARLTTLAPLPLGVAEGQVIQANIIFANSDTHAERLQRKVARDEARRIASSPRERAVLALNAGPRPAS